MRNIATRAIRLYKTYLSPFNISSCRFHPTCSEYAEEAIKEYGVLRGACLSFWRLLRCNPFSRGGYDPAIKK